MKPTLPLLTALLLASRAGLPADEAEIKVSIDPCCQRSIRGISELRRETYFGLCDNGTGFDRRCKSAERYDWKRSRARRPPPIFG